MKKWRTVILGILGIFFVLGLIIGRFIINNGYNKIVLRDINLLDWAFIICAAIAIIFMTYDLVKVQMDRKKFGNIDVYIKNYRSKGYKIVSVMMIVFSVIDIIICFITPSVMRVSMLFMMLFLCLFWLNRQFQRSGINKIGMYFWGTFFTWDKIQIYKNTGIDLIEVTVIQKMLGGKYDNVLYLKVSPDIINDVLGLFKENIVV